MCLAIYKPKGVQVAKKHLRNGFNNNEDGAGFAIARNGKIEIYKGFFKFGDFWKAYKGYQNEVAIIHFRWATHGSCSPENCHPFPLCGENFAVIHNGVLNIDCSNNKDRSDSFHFAELVLTPVLTAMPIDDPALRYLLETSIGSANKLVILRADGVHAIFNEKAGQWYKGAWYSNDGFLHSAPMWDWREAFNYASAKPKNYKCTVNGKREAFPDYKGHNDNRREIDEEYTLAQWQEDEAQARSDELEAEAEKYASQEAVRDYIASHRDGIVNLERHVG